MKSVTVAGQTIAYLKREAKPQVAGPGVFWLGGFRSDMTGTKAQALDAWAERRGRACVRFDYSGHGASSGAFRDGTIGQWRDDALAVLDTIADGPQILVGSSMGGWIALLAALARPRRVAGMVLIAPAPDFTEDLMWRVMDDAQRRAILEEGSWDAPSDFGEPYTITKALIEDGRNHCLLQGPIALECPIRILQGMKDQDVPWAHAVKLVERLSGNPSLTLIKEGDHRLSTGADLKRMEETLDGLLADITEQDR